MLTAEKESHNPFNHENEYVETTTAASFNTPFYIKFLRCKMFYKSY